MKALVTGAGGQLGRALARCAPPGVELVALTRAELDLADAAAIATAFERHRPALVINAAAYTQVDAAETAPADAERGNATAPGLLAGACAVAGARLVHVSTDYVFDGSGCRPYLPGDETRPLGVYGASKRRGELAVLAALGEQALIVRTSWLYGGQGRNFLTRMLELLAVRPALKVVVDQVGAPTAVPDLARALWALADRGAVGIHHWCNSGVASWYDFAVAIAEEAQACGRLTRAAPVVPIPSSEFPTPARRPHYSVLDKRSAEGAIGASAAHWRVALRGVLAQASGGDTP